MPMTGGSNKNGDIYYLDPSLKEKVYVGGTRRASLPMYQNIAAFILWHERVEKALRVGLDMSYDNAHKHATEAEKKEVIKHGLDWQAYKNACEHIVRMNEKKPLHRLPRDFDPVALDEYRAEKSGQGKDS